MPFPTAGSYDLSNKDVVSFTLDDPTYDVNKPVLIDPRDPSRHVTHSQAKETVQRLIAGLHAAGLRKGDTVCIHAFNSIYFPLLVLAIIGAGGLSIGTNPSYTRTELVHAISVAKVKFVLSEPEIAANMLQAISDNKIDVGTRLFILDTQPEQRVPEGLRSWRTLLQHGKKDWIRFDDPERSANTVAQLYYTSGTTGLPKCAMTTHQNLVAQHQLAHEAHPKSHPFKIVWCMPFFHAGVQPSVLVSTLKEGREAYVMRRFELEPFLTYHTRYQLTEVFIVPPMINAIVMSGLADPQSKTFRPDCSLRGVRAGHTGAAPCSADLQRRFNSLLGQNATFTQIWGMTETTCIATMVPREIASKCVAGKLQAWGSVGTPLPCIQLKLVDEEGKDVTQRGRGEIYIKGPTVARGYFENEKATKESWDLNGFFKTGDVAEVDKETGLLYIVERLKELIKVRGFQCAPAELEGALTEHPEIVDAAVIGIKVSSEEERPKAYIVRRAGSSLSDRHVHEYMGNRLAGFKQLTGGIEFVDSIPKLPSGKILKRVLRERARQGSVSYGAPKL